jgi:hypothetical protein
MRHPNAFLLFLAAILIPSLSFSQDRVSGKAFTTRSEVLAQNGMVATAQPLATQVGLDILKKGGSALDAAIAANAMLGLVEPNGCGIGGDVFAIIWDAKTKQLYGFNGSGRAPELLTMEVFREKGMKVLAGRLATQDQQTAALQKLFVDGVALLTFLFGEILRVMFVLKVRYPMDGHGAVGRGVAFLGKGHGAFVGQPSRGLLALRGPF